MKSRAEGATALPNAVVKAKSRNDKIALASHPKQSGVKKVTKVRSNQ
jgi:hypothetical protein